MPPFDHGLPDRHIVALIIVVVIIGAIVAAWRNRRARRTATPRTTTVSGPYREPHPSWDEQRNRLR